MVKTNKISWEKLNTNFKSCVHLITCETTVINNFIKKKEDKLQIVCRVIQGEKCKTPKQLFQEWATKLPFPKYFGHNWDAFFECINELDEWIPSASYVFFITNINLLLKGNIFNNYDNDFKIFIDILKDSAKYWGNVKLYNPYVKRPPIPFHIVFHCKPREEKEIKNRFEKIGLEVEEETLEI